MRTDTVFKILKEKEARSLREGYRGDAAHSAWQRHVLELLIIIAGQEKKKKKRKPSAWNVFVGRYLREGKTLKQASADWRGIKK
jgi:hypothetical protein